MVYLAPISEVFGVRIPAVSQDGTLRARRGFGPAVDLTCRRGGMIYRPPTYECLTLKRLLKYFGITWSQCVGTVRGIISPD